MMSTCYHCCLLAASSRELWNLLHRWLEQGAGPRGQACVIGRPYARPDTPQASTDNESTRSKSVLFTCVQLSNESLASKFIMHAHVNMHALPL